LQFFIAFKQVANLSYLIRLEKTHGVRSTIQ